MAVGTTAKNKTKNENISEPVLYSFIALIQVLHIYIYSGRIQENFLPKVPLQFKGYTIHCQHSNADCQTCRQSLGWL